MGLGQSSVQGFAEDAVLKAMLADIMTEHLEIASYRTLIALAEMAGKPEFLPRLEETLRKEEAMAEWFDENLEPITRRFIEIKAAEERKSQAAEGADEAEPEDNDAAAQGEDSPTLWQTLENAETSGAYPNSTAGSTPDMTAAKPPSVPEPETPRSRDEQPPTAGVAPRPSRLADKPSDT